MNDLDDLFCFKYNMYRRKRKMSWYYKKSRRGRKWQKRPYPFLKNRFVTPEIQVFMSCDAHFPSGEPSDIFRLNNKKNLGGLALLLPYNLFSTGLFKVVNNLIPLSGLFM